MFRYSSSFFQGQQSSSKLKWGLVAICLFSGCSDFTVGRNDLGTAQMGFPMEPLL